MNFRYLIFFSLLCGSGIADAQNTLPNSGNVGINTLSPEMPLDVSGDANIGNIFNRFYLRISSSLFPELRFRTPTDNEIIRLGVVVGQQDFPAANGDFYIYSAETNTMPFVVKKNGNLSLVANSGFTGIGITEPKYKLNVAQDISMNNDIDVAQFGVSGASDPAKRVVMGYDVNGAGFGFIKAGWFQHQWTNLSLQPNGGNVGIGITNPSEKLSVNGKIRAKEIKVEATGWPDYVFDEGYKARNLEELESYIKANKHLPGMPSAKEIEANGIAVSEMLKSQQQKIEELTLQLIELNKKVTTLQQKHHKPTKHKK
jgi:hypothetical protein